MSGDVQPRKRKDKRRKKEGGSLGSIHEPIISHKVKRSESDDKKIFDLPDQGEKIHVQNEHGIGGNICVKIVFFCLFGLLIGSVALIYMKSTGSSDVDLPTIEESRFAEYFTGWLDDSPDDHEHEAVENNLDHDHDEHDEHDEHDDDDDHDLHQDDHDEDDDEHENEDDQGEGSLYKLFGLGNNEPEEEEDEKEDTITENEQSDSRPDVEEDDEDEEDDNEEEEEEQEKNESDNNEKNDESEEEDEEEKEDNDSGVDLNEQDDEEDDEDLSQMDEEDEEKYDASQVDEDEDEDENEEREIKGKKKVEDDDEDEDKDQNEDEEEASKNLSEEQANEDKDNEDDDDDDDEDDQEDQKEDDTKEQDNYKTDNDDLGFEEINISEEDLEDETEHKQVSEEVESKKESRKQIFTENEEELKVTKDESENEEEEPESGGVAVKLGVGIALIIVAHLVLVKKWKSMNNAPSDEILSTEIKDKKDIENLHSSIEPVISRRQTLVPENVYLNDEADEDEMEDEQEEEEEEEEEEEDEAYSEEECEEEEFTKSKSANWETFEKLSWNIKKNENEKGNDDRIVDKKELIEEEGEYEEDEEVEEEEEEEDEMEEEEEVEDEEEEEDEDEEEEDEDEEIENNLVKQKVHPTPVDERQEEIENVTPIPPPRSKTGKGEQDIDEDSIDQYEDFTKVEDTNQDGSKAGDEANNSGPEEQKTPEKKVGNEDEWAFRQELDFADEQFENNPKAAVETYDKIISKKPNMMRALIGRARALDHWAEKEKSNTHLKQAINAYKTLLLNHGHLLDDDNYVKLAERCIERMRFGGAFVSAIDVHKALILKYPNTPKYRNTLAVTYLMLNKIPQARVLLNETLTLWPDDGFALVHYGFILKTSDNNMEEGAKKLIAGIQTKQEGVIDGMFFFHLGDALNRLGRGEEAMKWYERGVKEGLFLNKYQRSLYNVNRLKGKPWWTKEETTYQDFFRKLEENWREIRREGLELLNSKGINLFKEEAENLKDTGDWKQLDLYFRGRKQPTCSKAPLTCSLVSSFKPASTCTRGQIKFSVMLPNTHVWPHCGPTNCRLRSHLGLVVPKKTYIRVAEETRSWEEGKFIIFDDSFEHEVWHNGTGLRLVLIVDVWHPELTNHERRTLSPI